MDNVARSQSLQNTPAGLDGAKCHPGPKAGRVAGIAFLCGLLAAPVQAEPVVIEDFGPEAAQRWQFITDEMAGGLSSGTAELNEENGDGFMIMRGHVSGLADDGFIQLLRPMPGGLPADTTQIDVTAIANGQTYFIQLRTAAAAGRSWKYYSAPFTAGLEWTTTALPLTDFRPNGGMPARFTPQSVISLSIVAATSDQSVALVVSEITAR